MSLQICAPVSVIRNEKPNNSNNTCPYKTAKVRHLPQQIQSLSAQPPLPNVKHALAARTGRQWPWWGQYHVSAATMLPIPTSIGTLLATAAMGTIPPVPAPMG